jgi:hypothetical protein
MRHPKQQGNSDKKIGRRTSEDHNENTVKGSGTPGIIELDLATDVAALSLSSQSKRGWAKADFNGDYKETRYPTSRG